MIDYSDSRRRVGSISATHTRLPRTRVISAQREEKFPPLDSRRFFLAAHERETRARLRACVTLITLAQAWTLTLITLASACISQETWFFVMVLQVFWIACYVLHQTVVLSAARGARVLSYVFPRLFVFSSAACETS